MAPRECSFCGKPEDQVRRLIVGPGVYICDECVALSQRILEGDEGGGNPDAPPTRAGEAVPDLAVERWLSEVFEPALRDRDIAASNVVARLTGGLEALEACGLLEPEFTAEAQQRMLAAQERALRRPDPQIVRARSVAAEPANLLRHVFAPLTPLADFDGVTLVLASVELWTRSVDLRVAGLNNATSDRLDGEHRRALEGWAARVREANEQRNIYSDPPREPAARLLGMGLTLTDDVGTEYRWTGGSAGGPNIT